MTARPWLADVSDTARWVAHFRAVESNRPDALFRDPYAERLAGERGATIAKRLPAGPLSWSIAVRTRVYDDWILDTLATRGFDSVLHLAAGFDTRPYRLPLSAAVRWIEVDLPALIEEKARLLEGEHPRVQLERVGLDLADETARRELFASIGGRVLIVTEGFLIYLDEAQVASLARDLRAAFSDSAWLLLNTAPEILKRQRRLWGKRLHAAGAPQKFAPREGLDFFRSHGWRVTDTKSLLLEAQRLHREMRGAWLLQWSARVFPRRHERLLRAAQFALLEPMPRDVALPRM